MKLNLIGAIESLEAIKQNLEELPALDLANFEKNSTVLIHVDIVEGFLNFGALHSKDVAGILPFVAELNQRMEGYTKIFVIDRHNEEAVEFNAYPAHCVVGSGEDQLVKELLPFCEGELMIEKNSTNLFHAPGFQKYLEENPQINDFVFVGDVTDICVLQATLSLRSYFNEHNINKNLHVLLPGVDTFDLDATHHHRGLMNLFSLYNMQMNGIHLYGDIK
ncbi:MAG: cysteine hydrolase [Tissierellia bacterium]|nr:cysteine hydrolase [Tissierellia bacterium]